MVWHRAGDKSLSEAKMTYFIDASVGLDELTLLQCYVDLNAKGLGVNFTVLIFSMRFSSPVNTPVHFRARYVLMET